MNKDNPVIAYMGHYTCPAHDFHSIVIDDIEGVGGTRMLGGKCCGRWELVKRWPVRAKDVDEFVDTLVNERDSALKAIKAKVKP